MRFLDSHNPFSYNLKDRLNVRRKGLHVVDTEPQPSRRSERWWFLLLMSAAVGPFALYWVWRSRQVSVVGKATWSFLLLAVTALSAWLTWEVVRRALPVYLELWNLLTIPHDAR